MKTDTQLKYDILSELEWEPSINASQIGVEVKDGVVTLAGHVDSYGEKWHAERAVERVSGVRALAVEIAVKLPGSSKRSDTEIAHIAESALKWQTFLPEGAIHLMVESGWITLSGRVEWEYQRQAANTAVRHLLGVKGVNDEIVINAKLSAGNVKANIESALKRRAVADGQKIAVTVDGPDVTLSGSVSSWTEREQAWSSAWGTAGVERVVNNITVV
jgi:osmotically-inducible protein OsmY